MKNKKGVSLVVLVITIIVMIILASVIIFVSADATNNSKMAAFASDLTQIEDVIEEYYLNNNELPIVSGVSYSKGQVINLISEGSTTLNEEIIENGDDSAVFYKVDLAKLPIDSSYRGIEADGDITDIYLVSSQNFNVYYLKGEKIANEYYFSLTARLIKKSKINSNSSVDTSNIVISNTTAGIKLTKNTGDWTNNLTVDVETTLNTNETIEYLLAGTSAGTSTEGTFTVNVSDILDSNSTLKNTFYNSDANKVLTINKYDTSSGSNVLVASASITVTNLDMLSGTASPVTENTQYSNFTLVNISGYSDIGGSGIKEARVLYTTKLDENGSLIDYYEDLPDTITSEYVKNVGVSSAANIIKLPSDVVDYLIVFIDNAGNLSAIYNLSTS